MSNQAVTDTQVGEALGWTICNTPHSTDFPRTPYWDDDGGYEDCVANFTPTTDIGDALDALERTGISAVEICEFILKMKEASE
ncbi:MAG: hypothetical protein IID46_04690 [Planctomycetes bacterium]|nr:hypothetical protein [Planctomycetota bacterium]